ncbi:protein peste-like [Haematobia irritans]|uniref:protein peste-like n=1 Tax=Haematobia irritans TaxID=7368 RepID=UPI003F508794
MPHRSSKMLLKTTRIYIKYFYVMLGLVIAAIGSLCTIFSRPFIDRFIDYNMQLRPNADITKMWLHPDVNISLDFYFFNWTNSEDFYNMQTKPKLQQVGPISYTEVPIKKIFKWHPENNTLDYGKTHYYYHNEKRSGVSLNDTLISINSLMAGAASKSRNWAYFKRTIIDMALKFYQNGAVWKRTVDEFFFKGFNDEIVNLLSVLPVSLRTSLGVFMPWDRIGYAYARNGSTEFLGVHSIHTGVGDIDKLGQLVKWKGKNYTDAFDEECNAVRGSPGEFQKRHLKRHESIEYFFNDFCRALTMDYIDDVIIDGILGYRYHISPSSFDNGTLNAANKCYCHGECLPHGVFNVSSCYFGLPVMVSKPHFMDADPMFAGEVEGMAPNRTWHETSIILEPRTGLVIQLKGRLQLNVYIRPTTHIKSFPTKRKMLFPVVWFDMYAGISKDSSHIFRLVQNLAFYIDLMGISLIFMGIIITCWYPCKNQWNKRYIRHMDINTIQRKQDEEKDHDYSDNDEDDYEADGDNDIAETKDIRKKDNLFNLTSTFPSLMYLTSYPRRSLPIIISHLVGDDEAWKSCLEDELKQQSELAFDECYKKYDLVS